MDSIELHNPGPNRVAIGGWFLTDDFSNPQKFRIPDGITIPAGGFLVFDENDFSVGPNGFRLSEYGEQAYLFSGNAEGELTGYSHGWDFGASPNGITTGRYEDSQGKVHFVLQASNTLGEENSLPLIGPVIVSEIHYRPPDLDSGVNNDVDEYIELTNISSATVSLYNTDTSVPGYGAAALHDTWRLRNAVDFDFLTGVELEPGESILVVGFDPSTDLTKLAGLRSKFSVPDSVDVFGPWSGELNNAGEKIELEYPGSADPMLAFFVPYYTAEKIDYQDSPPWPVEADGRGSSLQRLRFYEFANDPQNWKADSPRGDDSDDDEMDDSWEILYGLIVGIDDSGLDSDGDGFTNLEEFLAKTRPNDPRSNLNLSIDHTATGLLCLRLTVAPNVAYMIQYSDSLASPISWTDMQEISAESEEGELQFEFQATEPRRFFRVILSVNP